MRYIKFLFITLFVSFITSCSSTKNVEMPKPKVKKSTTVVKHKPKNLTLSESLRKIGAKVGDPIFIRIFKEEKILELFVKVDGKYRLCKIYPICAYSGGLGPKLKQGDKQSPEGFYSVSKKQLKKKSKYHLAINIGFPNQYDRYQNRTGTYLMIHGKCSSTGCYAIRNQPIEEIFMMAEAALDNGQPKFDVHIFPFRMTKQNMARHRTSRWYPFWVNLKLGHDIFEKYKIVPIIKASKENYRFFMKKTKDKNGFNTLL